MDAVLHPWGPSDGPRGDLRPSRKGQLWLPCVCVCVGGWLPLSRFEEMGLRLGLWPEGLDGERAPTALLRQQVWSWGDDAGWDQALA